MREEIGESVYEGGEGEERGGREARHTVLMILPELLTMVTVASSGNPPGAPEPLILAVSCSVCDGVDVSCRLVPVVQSANWCVFVCLSKHPSCQSV